jgi:hypothetical protein
MIKHYFKIAIRNLGRQKVLAFINIAGLSLGLACFILFLLNAVNEFSFDRFHKDGENVYRVYRWTEAMQGEEAGGDVYLPMPLGPALKQDIPDVAEFVRLRDAWGDNFVKANDKISSVGTSTYLNLLPFLQLQTTPHRILPFNSTSLGTLNICRQLRMASAVLIIGDALLITPM